MNQGLGELAVDLSWILDAHTLDANGLGHSSEVRIDKCASGVSRKPVDFGSSSMKEAISGDTQHNRWCRLGAGATRASAASEPFSRNGGLVPVQADAVFDNYRLRKGETFEQLRLHYATLGAPHGLPRSSDLPQLVLSEQPAGANRDIGVVSLKTWRISDQVARHKLLLAGLGWCGMPEPIVRADIESGRLVRLNLRDWRG